jgi:FkbM family methyltransferase
MPLIDLISEVSGNNGIVQARYGLMLFNRHDRYIGRSIARYGEWCELELVLMKQLCRRGDVIVDAGANIGTHTLAFAQWVGAKGAVHAFEAQRLVYQMLCANAALNDIAYIDAHALALAESHTELVIPRQRFDIEANLGGVSLTTAGVGDRIAARPLDDILDPPGLRLLKIDVEGMERNVINGARGLIGRFRPYLYIENDRVALSKALIEAVFALDYRLFWHAIPLFNPNNFAADPDNIFAGVVSLNMLGVHNSVDLTVENLSEITDPAFHPWREKSGYT